MPNEKIICSLDIGSFNIKTLIVSIGLNNKLSLIGVSSTPSRGIKKGQIVDIESATKSIEESLDSAERMAGVSISSAFVSIGGPHIESINTSAVVAVSQSGADISGKDLVRLNRTSNALVMPASKEILHTLPISYVIDGQEGIKNPIGMSGTRLESETHIITTSSVAISNLIKCLQKVGIEIEEIVFSGIASAESVLTPTEKELGVILVDIGYETTDVVVFVDGAITYSSVLPIGARYITNDLAVGLKVSLESAEKIKLKLSDPELIKTNPDMIDKDQKHKKNLDLLDLKLLGLPDEVEKISIKSARDTIIRSRLREIFELVEKEIKRTRSGSHVPFGIVISGGGSLTVGAVEVAKYILGFPARIGIPDEFSGLAEEVDSPEFAVSSGLILHAVNNQDIEKQHNFQILGRNLPFKKWWDRIRGFIRQFLP